MSDEPAAFAELGRLARRYGNKPILRLRYRGRKTRCARLLERLLNDRLRHMMPRFCRESALYGLAMVGPSIKGDVPNLEGLGLRPVEDDRG